jgi:chaperonin GroEL
MGGGVTYVYIARELQKNISTDMEFAVGYTIVLEALRMPFKQLCINSEQPYETLLDTLLSNNDIMGVNFLTDLYCNPYEEGIVDPTKVLRVALENAVSIATLMLTTSSIVTSE